MNITLHNKRFNYTRTHWFEGIRIYDIRKRIKIPAAFQRGVVKCRVVYSQEIEDIEFSFYELRKIQSIRAVECSHLEYFFKFEDRSGIHQCLEQVETSDEILILRNGRITDTSYCNVAFSKNNLWYTPSNPLLPGVMRRKLIENGKILPENLALDDLRNYTHIALFNALIPFGKLVLPVSSIDF
ncbi:MAG TPA: aminotransferase class IV [Saprospiraceae bacterium]|nr:aminotransferase class IV [Saprospiraceae bacterium]